MGCISLDFIKFQTYQNNRLDSSAAYKLKDDGNDGNIAIHSKLDIYCWAKALACFHFMWHDIRTLDYMALYCMIYEGEGGYEKTMQSILDNYLPNPRYMHFVLEHVPETNTSKLLALLKSRYYYDFKLYKEDVEAADHRVSEYIPIIFDHVMYKYSVKDFYLKDLLAAFRHAMYVKPFLKCQCTLLIKGQSGKLVDFFRDWTAFK